jgi:hypothetical protein
MSFAVMAPPIVRALRSALRSAGPAAPRMATDQPR